MSAPDAGLTERVAAVLAEHHWSAEVSPPEGVDPYLWCVCGWRSDDATAAHWASFEHARLANAHVATALAPLVAEEVAAAEVRALREAAAGLCHCRGCLGHREDCPAMALLDCADRTAKGGVQSDG